MKDLIFLSTFELFLDYFIMRFFLVRDLMSWNGDLLRNDTCEEKMALKIAYFISFWWSWEVFWIFETILKWILTKNRK